MRRLAPLLPACLLLVACAGGPGPVAHPEDPGPSFSTAGTKADPRAEEPSPVPPPEPEPAAGPARANIILSHGLTEHAGRHFQTARWLAGLGCRVFLLDLAGHGGYDPQLGGETTPIIFEDVFRHAPPSAQPSQCLQRNAIRVLVTDLHTCITLWFLSRRRHRRQ